jgi:hypothetical protein
MLHVYAEAQVQYMMDKFVYRVLLCMSRMSKPSELRSTATAVSTAMTGAVCRLYKHHCWLVASMLHIGDLRQASLVVMNTIATIALHSHLSFRYRSWYAACCDDPIAFVLTAFVLMLGALANNMNT